MKNILVTCETSSCENSGIEIQLTTDADSVICGPCGNFINNIKEI